MCGICGIHEYESRQPVEEHVLAAMLGVIRHRGPDDEGMYVDRHFGMGMRRLSIIDLCSGKQPIWNEDKTVAVVFNGEIYNYLELRDALRRRGHTFVTNSDTEVIVHLYEERGEDCVLDLRGMFGFAVWDLRKQCLFLARDRLGIKPLYYTDTKGAVIFGSEIKAILQHPKAEVRLDPAALSHYLSLKYVPASKTMFAGIHALPPGHTLTCSSKGTRIRSYWRLSFAAGERDCRSEAECMEQLDALLRDCVKSHLMSDVPFGAFLSGGVDSSTVVALMSQFLDRPVKTFAVGFDGGGASVSELPYARMVAKRWQAEHHEILVRPADLTDLAETVIWHLDQPIADNACLANYMLAGMASRQVKMVLTGEGGDELFAGYARYAGERLSPWFQVLPPPARAGILRTVERLTGLRRLKLATFALCQPAEAVRFANWFPLFNYEMKSLLLSGEYRRTVQNVNAEDVIAEHLTQTDAGDRVNRMLYVDTKLWLPDDLLARGDKMSMAASLEARVPLLDHKLVEFAAALPPHLKLNRLTRKYLLKKVARPWLPPAVIDRKKQGFPMPFSVWFRKEARSFVHDLLSPKTVRRRGLFDCRYVQQLLEQHDSGTADHSALIWGLLSVELWHRVFLDSPQSARSRSASVLPVHG